MENRIQQARRWVDQFLTLGRRTTDLKDMSRQQHADLRVAGNVYRKIASKYLSEARFDASFEIIAAFLMFIYKRGALVRTATEDDIFDYFVWISKKGCPIQDVRTNAACVTDLFLALLQEGTVQTNTLFKVYRLLAEGETFLKPTQTDALLQRLLASEAPQQHRAAPHYPPHTPVSPSPGTPHAPMPPPPHTPYPRPMPAYPPPTQRRHYRGVWVTVVILFVLGIAFMGGQYLTQQQTLTEETTTAGEGHTFAQSAQPSPPQPPATMPTTTQPADQTQDSLTFFYKHAMKHYYCRDYLNIACSETQLLANPMPADLENVHEGRTHFFKYCVRCHGDDGRGRGPDAIYLEAPLTQLRWAGNTLLEKDAYLFWIIAEGGEPFGGHMPQFKSILDEQAIWKIILFVETLR